MKGIMALDIDGTLVEGVTAIPAKTQKFLEMCVLKGWKIVLITGRTYPLSLSSLQGLSFPFKLAPQNGAYLIEWPADRIISSQYLSSEKIEKVVAITASVDCAIQICWGKEKEYQVWMVEKAHSPALDDFLKKRQAKTKEPWSVAPWTDALQQISVPSVKILGDRSSLTKVVAELKSCIKVHAPINSDPFVIGWAVCQVTDFCASKGNVVDDLRRMYGHEYPVIGAGNDFNDMSMLEKVDIAIAMEEAPNELLNIADIIAPSIRKEGVIEALEIALSKV